MNKKIRVNLFLSIILSLLSLSSYGAGYSLIANSDAGAQQQLYAGVQPYGALAVETTPTTIFNDPFDGGTVDVTNRWITQVVTGTVTQSNGSLIVAPTTTASAYASISSIPSFPTPGAAWQLWGATLTITTATNTLEYWGLGTVPGTPTTAAPITTGIGFQIDAAGAFKGVVYSSGSVIGSCDLTAFKSYLSDGQQHGYGFLYRADAILMIIDNINQPVCFIRNLQTASAALPVALLAVNSSTPPTVTPSISFSLVTVADYGKNSQSIMDGTFSWRRATVDVRNSLSIGNTGTFQRTYSASTNIVAAAAATDIFCITGNATTTVYLTKLIITGIQTTGGLNDISFIKHSTADTGGTSSGVAATPHDSTDAAASATLLAYTANPAAIGTVVGTPIRRGYLPVAGATSIVNPIVVFDFGTNGKEIILRGIAQQACINLNGATLTGGTFDISSEWFER